MTYEEARNLIKSRSRPKEDDWDLFEAAAIMLQNNDDLCKSALDGMKYSGLINDYHVAQSRIAALEEENAKLKKATEGPAGPNCWEEMRERIFSLEAEVERLRVIATQFARAIPKPTGIIGCPTCEGTGETEAVESCNVCGGMGHLNMESI